jgi:hypothetical protein
MNGDEIDSAATERRREQWRVRKQRQRERQALMVITRDIAPPLSPSIPAPSVTFTRDMVTVQRDPIPFRIGRNIVGLVLISAALMVAYTSMRANAWFGYALSIDDNAGQIFASLTRRCRSDRLLPTDSEQALPPNGRAMDRAARLVHDDRRISRCVLRSVGIRPD